MEKLFCPLKQRFSTTQNPHCETMEIREYYMGDCDENKCAWWIKYLNGADPHCAIVAISYELSGLKK